MVTLIALFLLAPQPQPTPQHPPGRHEKLSLGTLFIPARIATRHHLPLVVHFHGEPWVPEAAAARDGHIAVISVQTGGDSTTYTALFAKPEAFAAMLSEASKKTGMVFGPITLTSWSAGYGAVRQILQVPRYYSQVHSVLLIDGLHTDYIGGKPDPKQLQIFLQFAKDAVAGHKRMIVTHSEIVPGTFASTTETAAWLAARLGLKEHAMRGTGPMQIRQLTEVRQGKLTIAGYAGNDAQDHVNQFNGLPVFLGLLRH